MLGNLIYRFGRALQRLGLRIASVVRRSEVWIDVGAHDGENTFEYARQNPCLRVYAVEPNLSAASKLAGRLSNYVVLPVAIAEQDGSADFYLSAYDQASSLLSFNEGGLREWDGRDLRTVAVSRVPTMRLDTLMKALNIESVDFLKIDTQGMDLSVLKSAGTRLKDIATVRLEVWIGQAPLYSGAPSKKEVIEFLEEAGFTMTNREEQTGGREENLTFVRNHALDRADCSPKTARMESASPADLART